MHVSVYSGPDCAVFRRAFLRRATLQAQGQKSLFLDATLDFWWTIGLLDYWTIGFLTSALPLANQAIISTATHRSH